MKTNIETKDFKLLFVLNLRLLISTLFLISLSLNALLLLEFTTRKNA